MISPYICKWKSVFLFNMASEVKLFVFVEQVDWSRTLILAFQSMGVVYGDIGTSPLYVFSSTFTDHKIENKDDIIGVLSLIIYTIVLIPLLKYVFIVLRANDNGDGGLTNIGLII